MVVDHVPIGSGHDSGQPAAVEERPAGLVRDERRERPQAVRERVHTHPRMRFRRFQRRATVEKAVRVQGVDDVDLVPGVGERVREPPDVDRIAAEVVRRVERREVKEAQADGSRPRAEAAGDRAAQPSGAGAGADIDREPAGRERREPALAPQVMCVDPR